MSSGRHAHRGFTLVEVLIALSIIGLMAALAAPAMMRRLDAAFRSADLAQVVASARLLPVRAAALGMETTLDAKGLKQPFSDGQLAIELPPGWSLAPQSPPLRLGRGGSCSAAQMVLVSPPPVQRWMLQFSPLSCEVRIEELGGAA